MIVGWATEQIGKNRNTCWDLGLSNNVQKNVKYFYQNIIKIRIQINIDHIGFGVDSNRQVGQKKYNLKFTL